MEKKKVKILIVDDEQVHRYMLYSMLTEWGWSCQEAGDGETAVEAVRQGPFDVILLDVCMEPMDGLEALRKIHA
ncbi:MAG: response regulator, partial [Candidatus Electrothrix sp. AR1]|nr:response regulator [Candidatus Electrothrix sp. AR1]